MHSLELEGGISSSSFTEKSLVEESSTLPEENTPSTSAEATSSQREIPAYVDVSLEQSLLMNFVASYLWQLHWKEQGLSTPEDRGSVAS